VLAASIWPQVMRPVASDQLLVGISGRRWQKGRKKKKKKKKKKENYFKKISLRRRSRMESTAKKLNTP
jgi:hypothetical protein